MRKQFKWTISLAVLSALAMGTSLLAQEQDQGKPPVYTYVANWVVPRAQWGDMAKINEADRAGLEKFLADGTITGYGEFENFIHTEGEPTHGSWFTAASEGNILKELESDYAQPDLTAPVLAASKHYDLFLISHIHNARHGTFDNAYLSGSSWQVKPGRAREFSDLVKIRIVPFLDKLIADGTLVSYSLDSLYYDTQRPGEVTFVTIAANASAQDKLDRTFEAAFGKDPELDPAVASLTVAGERRDFLYHVTHMVNK
jgi:hypothetical protein